MKIKKFVSLAYFDKSGKFRNFINVSDGIFGKIRFVGIGLICTNIQFGGLMFKNKKVVTLCVKKGGECCGSTKRQTTLMEIFIK